MPSPNPWFGWLPNSSGLFRTRLPTIALSLPVVTMPPLVQPSTWLYAIRPLFPASSMPPALRNSEPSWARSLRTRRMPSPETSIAVKKALSAPVSATTRPSESTAPIAAPRPKMPLLRIALSRATVDCDRHAGDARVDVQEPVSARVLARERAAERLDAAVANRHVVEAAPVVDRDRPSPADRDPAVHVVSREVDVDTVGSDDEARLLRAEKVAGELDVAGDDVAAAGALGGEAAVLATAGAALLLRVLGAEAEVVERGPLEPGDARRRPSWACSARR